MVPSGTWTGGPGHPNRWPVEVHGRCTGCAARWPKMRSKGRFRIWRAAQRLIQRTTCTSRSLGGAAGESGRGSAPGTDAPLTPRSHPGARYGATSPSADGSGV